MNGFSLDIYAYDIVSGRLERVEGVDEVHRFGWNPEGMLAWWEASLSRYVRVYSYDEEGRLVRNWRRYAIGAVLVMLVAVLGIWGYLHQDRSPSFDPFGWQVIACEKLYQSYGSQYFFQCTENYWIHERRRERDIIRVKGQTREVKYVSRIRYTTTGGTLELLWFDNEGRIVEYRKSSVAADISKRNLDQFQKSVGIGRTFPSVKEIEASLLSKGAKEKTIYCGRDAYIRRIDGLIICYDARTGIRLGDWSWINSRWEQTGHLIYARWTLRKNHQQRIYSIHCRDDGLAPVGLR